MKIKMRKYGILLILLFILFAISRNKKILKTTLERKNPIEYVFNVSIDSIHKMSIKNKYSLFEHAAVWTIKEKLIIPMEIVNNLEKPANKYDMFIDARFDNLKSYTYKNHEGEYLEYLVSFYIHLDSIDISKTKVSIETFDPKLIRDHDLLPSPPHFVRNPKWLIGEPSTIEEYSILLNIGKSIGEKNMPSLILPDMNTKFEIVKY
jgi:hypothetical protein